MFVFPKIFSAGGTGGPCEATHIYRASGSVKLKASTWNFAYQLCVGGFAAKHESSTVVGCVAHLRHCLNSQGLEGDAPPFPVRVFA